jgi:hypothetical protein
MSLARQKSMEKEARAQRLCHSKGKAIAWAKAMERKAKFKRLSDINRQAKAKGQRQSKRQAKARLSFFESLGKGLALCPLGQELILNPSPFACQGYREAMGSRAKGQGPKGKRQ